MLTIRARVYFRGGVVPREGGVVHVRVEYAGVAGDVAPAVVFQRDFSKASCPELSRDSVLVSFSCDEVEGDHPLSLWTHLDLDGSGTVTHGDYVTTQSYVLPRTTGIVEMEIELQRVA